MTQAGQAPPRFVLFASQPDAVNASYHKFLIRRLRENFGFVGATVRLDVRLSE
jgi:GTP-binding protein